MMFIIQLTYKAPLAEIDKYLQQHRDFLDEYYAKGILLASGPMIPRTGGIIVAIGKEEAELKAIFQLDPFYQADVATYHFVPFTPVKYCKDLQNMMDKMERDAC